MKKAEIRDQRIEIRLSKTEKENIEKMAEKLDIPPSTLMRNLILTSYDNAKIFDNLGFLTGVKKLDEFKEKFSSVMSRNQVN